MSNSDLDQDATTPTQKDLDHAAEIAHLKRRVSNMRDAMLHLVQEDKEAEEAHKKLLSMREIFAQERKEEEAERRRQSATSESGPSHETASGPEILSASTGGLRRTRTHRDLRHVFGHMDYPETKSRPAPIVVQPRTSRRRSSNVIADDVQIVTVQDHPPHAPQHERSRSWNDTYRIDTARPFVARPLPNLSSQDQLSSPQSFFSSSSLSLLSQQASPFTPPWSPAVPEKPQPQIDNANLIVLTPYMRIDTLKEVIHQLPLKLQDLLRSNKGVYWPYVEEWFRNQDDEDLDDEAMDLCMRMPLGTDRTLYTWDQNVVWARKLRLKS